MLSQAIAKLKAEIDQNKNNSYIQIVGDFLLRHLDTHPDSAERIMTEGKTVGHSLDEMRKAAEKKKTGNCAVLTDQEGFAIVLKYFGIDQVAGTPDQASPVQKPKVDFDVKLEDLLPGVGK